MGEVCLVQMPFAMATTPSLALSLFKSSLSSRGIEVSIKYGNIKLIEDELGIKLSSLITNLPIFPLFGEFVFSHLLGLPKKYSDQEYFAYIERTFTARTHLTKGYLYLKENITFIKEKMKLFVDQLAEEINAEKPKIVACTSLFQQNNASLALLKRLKELNPAIITAMGGPNCMVDAGMAFLDHFPWLDYAFSGEGDEYIPITFEKLLNNDCAFLPSGVLSRSSSRDDIPYPIVENMENILMPDYDDYFKALEEYGLKERMEPALFIEGSRGCWWGQKKPCTFCGLGGKSRVYREKSAEKVYKEMKYLSERYKVKRFAFTDSILSQKHLKELTKLLQNEDYEIFSEIKSNLNKEEIRLLREAGFTYLQPGIEGLHDEVLKLMHKGNKGLKHIELLKNCRIFGIGLSWNILYGFPGEKDEWYENLNELIPLITHLHPPNAAIHIMYQKYSVYLDYPEKYGLDLQKVKFYDFVYPDLPDFIDRIAYMFEPVGDAKVAYYDLEKRKDCYRVLDTRVKQWMQAFFYKYDRLEMEVKKDEIEIMDFRQAGGTTFVTLQGLKKEIYLLAENVVKIESVKADLQACFASEAIEAAIAELIEQKLLLRYQDEILALAVKLEDYSNENVLNRNPLGKIRG